MPRSISTPVLLAGNALLALSLLWSTAQSQTPAPVQDVLRAKLIELVNDNGDVVGQFYLGEGGSGQLRLRNGHGDVRVKLGPSNDGSGAALVLMDARTEPVVVVAAEKDGATLTLEGIAVTP
jgi:hypothetical protein